MRDHIILEGDCLELLPELEDGSVDMVLCDLPYGTTQNKWDSVIPFGELWRQYRRILKPNSVVVLSAQTPFDKVLGCSNLPWLKYEWIWEKNVATGHLNANKAPMKKHENILVFSEGQPTYHPQMSPGKPYKMKRKPINDNGSNYGTITRTDTVNNGQRYPISIIPFGREIGLHPTQKPVALWEYLILTYTNKGDTVLDNCCGSGTTGVACKNTGRKSIQMDISEEYCEIARKRLRGEL